MKLATAAVFGLVFMSAPAFAGQPEGTWLSGDGGTKVKISNCGGKLCGSVVWLKDPKNDSGKPKTDIHNPDEAKRSRPMLGLQVVHGLAPDGANRWSGNIYNADDGKTYSAHMTVGDGNSADVQGCVLGVLCKTQKWTRAD
jgi:uncharacterized protein (DUF2147 family)